MQQDDTPQVGRRVKVSLGSSKARVGVPPGSAGAELVSCHVCGESGHSAGWIGASYIDCCSFACFLCKRLGHTMTACPFRIRSADTSALSIANPINFLAVAGLPTSWRRRGTLAIARARGMGLDAPARTCRLAQYDVLPSPCGRDQVWRVSAALLSAFSRRVSVISFVPVAPSRLVACDKSGELVVWDWTSRREGGRHVFAPHRWLINALAWAHTSPHAAYTASADGTVRRNDISTSSSDCLASINPAGWHDDGKMPDASWRMFMSVACARAHGSAHTPVIAGDDVGRVWALDPMQRRCVIGRFQAHRRGSKVTGLEYNPADERLFATCGGDWAVRLWDVRSMSWQSPPDAEFATEPPFEGGTRSTQAEGSLLHNNNNDAPATAAAFSGASSQEAGYRSRRSGVQSLVTLLHPRAVTTATFSNITGTRLLTTCIDNRLRVFNVNGDLQSGDCLEIVHSHDFGRYLTPFRAVWDPKDVHENTAVCGRYVSEPFDFHVPGSPPAAVALHPVDVLLLSPPNHSATRMLPPSRIVAQLADPLVTTISPVVAVHPTINAIASGSSRSVYVWLSFQRDRDPLLHKERGSRAQSGRDGSSSEDSDDGDSHGGQPEVKRSRPRPKQAAAKTTRS